MLLAAIETSRRSGSVALLVNGELHSRDLADARRHACDLVPALEELRREAGLPSEPRFDAVAVGVGPGSYTGLRVGIASALGLARGCGAQMIAIPSAEALVWCEARSGEELVVLLDARQREVYFTHLRREQAEVRTLVGPSVIAVDELAGRFPARVPIFADSAALGELLAPDDAARLRTDARPHARGIAELAALRLSRGETTPLDAVQPLYLRPFGSGKSLPS